MTYEEAVNTIVKIVEAFGVAVMVLGGVGAFVRYAADLVPRRADSEKRRPADSYKKLRQNLGYVILLGLEVLIVADIVRTIVVDQTVQSVGVLAGVVLIRIILSFALEVEINGSWPWRGRSDER